MQPQAPLQRFKIVLIFCLTLVINSHLTQAIEVEPTAETQAIGKRTDEVKCKFRNPKEFEIHNATYMASRLLGEMTRLNEEYQKKGEDLKLLLVARTGTNPKGLTLLSDELPLDEMIAQGRRDHLDKIDSGPQVNRGVLLDRFKLEGETGLHSNRDNRFSHIGIMYKDYGDRWSFIHMLYQCGRAVKGTDRIVPGMKGSSRIWTEGVSRFFIDKPYDYKAHLMIPTKELRDRMYDFLIDTSRTTTKTGIDGEEQLVYATRTDNYYPFLTARYNAASAFGSLTDQNSNQWPLEVMVANMAPQGNVVDRMGAIDYMVNRAEVPYRPTRLHLSGRFGFANLASKLKFIKTVNGHEQPYIVNNVAEVATALSVYRFMKDNDVLDQNVKISIPRQYIHEKSKKVLKNLRKADKKARKEAKRAAKKAKKNK